MTSALFARNVWVRNTSAIGTAAQLCPVSIASEQRANIWSSPSHRR